MPDYDTEKDHDFEWHDADDLPEIQIMESYPVVRPIAPSCPDREELPETSHNLARHIDIDIEDRELVLVLRAKCSCGWKDARRFIGAPVTPEEEF